MDIIQIMGWVILVPSLAFILSGKNRWSVKK